MKNSSFLPLILSFFSFSALICAEDAPATETPAAPEAEAPASDAGTPDIKPPERKVAAPLFSRHGMIYSAEITLVKPVFGNEIRANQPRYKGTVDGRETYVPAAWVEIVVKPHRSRSVSRFDYDLETPSGKYECLAVAKNDDAYSQLKECWTILSNKIQKDDFVRYLYSVPPSDIPADKDLIPGTWKLALSSTKLPPVEFQIRVLPKDQAFSKVAEQPKTGSLGLTWKELHPEAGLELSPVEEAPADAAAPAAENKEESKPAAAAAAPDAKK